MPRLRRVDCSGPGITRRRRGKGFEYLDEHGNRVTDPEVLTRIRSLVIPPAWESVWICSVPNGHIQAIGTDAAGRKQYLYHEDWRKRRDAEKFEHMLEFADALPVMRRRCVKDLRRTDYPRERVLACALRLLDRGFFRIGTEGYAEQNQTYGLATMLKKHITIEGTVITFDYVAKSGKRRVQSLVDADVLEVVKGLKGRRAGGPELLAYKDGRTWTDVKSADINAYVKDLTGGDFTAKDFRTWNGTVLAAMMLADHAGTEDPDQAVVDAIKMVSDILGNTPAVCRASYVDPRVISSFEQGKTIKPAVDRLSKAGGSKDFADRAGIEKAVIRLIS